MKRIVTLLLAAGLVFGASMSAQAADVKVSGNWLFTFDAGDSNNKNPNMADRFDAMQRLRTQVDIIASESLKGVVYFEIGTTDWGNGADGASLGNDGKAVKVRYSYLDWMVPNTDLKVRMGLQNFTLPNFVAGSTVLGGGSADGAGITLSYAFNENVGASLFWLRAENDNAGAPSYSSTLNYKFHDAMDVFGVTLPMKFDGFKVTPYGLFSIMGNDSLTDPGNYGQISDVRAGLLPVNAPDGYFSTSSDTSGTAWWGGLGAEMTAFAPFRVAFDGVYGSVDMGSTADGFDLKRSGWYTSLLAEYKMDFMTPGLMFWYASGDDSNPTNGSERLPSLRANFIPTTYGYNNTFGLGTDSLVAKSAAGTWGIMGRLDKISFIEDMQHVMRVAYTRGTNNTSMAWKTNGYTKAPNYTTNYTYLTTSDTAIEVNFDTSYKIYQDLLMVLELSYLNLDMDDSVWSSGRGDSVNKNNFRGSLNLQYSF